MHCMGFSRRGQGLSDCGKLGTTRVLAAAAGGLSSCGKLGTTRVLAAAAGGLSDCSYATHTYL